MVDIDYTSFGIGGLCQATIDIMKEICRRFGPDKGENVYLTAKDHFGNYGEKSMALEILTENDVEVTDNDIAFLKKIIEAEGCIEYAKKLLREAANGKA